MKLLAFLVAMTGPLNPADFNGSDFTGCKMSSWFSRSCLQRPGEQPKCEDYDSGPIWDCRRYHPANLQFDYDGDLDVDLRDFAEVQNRER